MDTWDLFDISPSYRYYVCMYVCISHALHEEFELHAFIDYEIVTYTYAYIYRELEVSENQC